MVANQSYATGDPAKQAILDVETGRGGAARVHPGAEGQAEAQEEAQAQAARSLNVSPIIH